MIKDQVLAAVHKYDGWLAKAGIPVEKIDLTITSPGRQAALAHLRQMFAEMGGWTEDKAGKADRWIGFVQGVLWLAGFGSIEEFKDDNR